MTTLPIITGEFGIVGDPEIRYSDKGKAWAKVRGSFKERVRDSMGNWTDGERMFIDLIINVGAENLGESIAAGDTIVVTGRFMIRNWKDKDGNDRYTPEIRADNIGVSLRWGPAKTAKVLGDAGNVANAMDALGATEVAPF